MDNKDSSDIIELMFSQEHINNKNITMNQELKRHIVSALTTFGSTFLVTLALIIGNDAFTFSQEALLAGLLSALVAGVRSLAKVVIEWNTGKIS